MSNVVPMKPYTYPKWCRITAQINDLREKDGRAQWSEQDAAALWHDLFDAPAKDQVAVQ